MSKNGSYSSLNSRRRRSRPELYNQPSKRPHAVQSCIANDPIAVANGNAGCDFILEQEAIGAITLALSSCMGADDTTCNHAVDAATQTTSGLLAGGPQTVTAGTSGVEAPGSCVFAGSICGPPGGLLHNGCQCIGFYRYLVVIWTDEIKWGIPLPAVVHWSADNGVIAQDEIIQNSPYAADIYTWFDNWYMSVYNVADLPFAPQMTDHTLHYQYDATTNSFVTGPIFNHSTAIGGQQGIEACQQNPVPSVQWTCGSSVCADNLNDKAICMHDQSPMAHETDSSEGARAYSGDAFVEPDDIRFDDSAWVPIEGDEHAFYMGGCFDPEAIGPPASSGLVCFNAPSN